MRHFEGADAGIGFEELPDGFAKLPGMYWPVLLATLAAYVILTQLIKVWLLRRKWI